MSDKNNTQYIEYIDHPAVIKEIDYANGVVKLMLTDAEDCGGCPAARLCSLATKEGKNDTEYTITVDDASQFRPGEKVSLRGTEKMHRRAIMLATVIPCICLIIIMTATYLLTGNQATAAVAGVTSMVFFFTLLYLLRNKLEHEFEFTIHHS